jgi:hypothetical protein
MARQADRAPLRMTDELFQTVRSHGATNLSLSEKCGIRVRLEGYPTPHQPDKQTF